MIPKQPFQKCRRGNAFLREQFPTKKWSCVKKEEWSTKRRCYKNEIQRYKDVLPKDVLDENLCGWQRGRGINVLNLEPEPLIKNGRTP